MWHQLIVNASQAFICDDGDTPTCHHGSLGPPLKAFTFDMPGSERSRLDAYLSHVLRAIQYVADTYSGMRLHDRLAFAVSDVAFCAQLRPRLNEALKSTYQVDGRPRFELKDAKAACRSCPALGADRREAPDGKEWLIFDTVDALEGLERLILIAVNLDSPVSGSSTLESRSRLYRALTRAHMLVLVVNAHISTLRCSEPTGLLSSLRSSN